MRAAVSLASSLAARHARVTRGRAMRVGRDGAPRHRARRIAHEHARTQLRTRGRARAGVARGSCRAMRVAHEAAGGAREALAAELGALVQRDAPRCTCERAPHCHVRPLARSGCARSCWVVRAQGGQRAGGAGGLSHAPLSGGAVGRCGAPRDQPARGLASFPPSCMVPPLLLGPPTPAPHGTRPVLAANQGHGMSVFFVYADRILATLQVLCSIPRQFGYGGSDANLRTCIGGGLGASIQGRNASEGILHCAAPGAALDSVHGGASPRPRARRGARR